MVKRKKQSLLSKSQSQRLGGLIQVLGSKEPIDEIITSLKSLNMIVEHNDCLMLTDKGLDETSRLSTLAGLLPKKKNSDS